MSILVCPFKPLSACHSTAGCHLVVIRLLSRPHGPDVPRTFAPACCNRIHPTALQSTCSMHAILLALDDQSAAPCVPTDYIVLRRLSVDLDEKALLPAALL